MDAEALQVDVVDELAVQCPRRVGQQPEQQLACGIGGLLVLVVGALLFSSRRGDSA